MPNFAQDESCNHDSENCSEISAVTRFRICPELLHFPTFMFFTPPYCIYVLQLNQLKVCCLNFSAKVSRQEAAERERADKLTFEKSSVVMARWLENQNTTSLANETSSSLKEDQIVPLQCLPGEAKLLKNDWK